jgi:hypothetical protein
MHERRLAKLVHSSINMHLEASDQLADMVRGKEGDMEAMIASFCAVVAEIGEERIQSMK